MTAIPTLATERLLLRPMRAEDWAPFSTLMQSERARFMGGPHSVSAAWGMFCADHAQWDFFGAGSLMLEDRQTGACLGQVGINSGPLFPEQEMGWLLFDGAEGQGYAFEAASAFRDWARDVRQLATLVSYVDPQNDRSCRLAERLGAVLDKTARGQDPTDLVYRHFG
ncbi:GNAT family N-acetyltransferase [Paracoccus sulfuroxidans]|uniref:RimJ/RimL family protein N-acetyltransferase n=1 Tax=Paracoccus sulfuroxidans TaxID=384678 RepID=A0A562NT71_9RHOB|nr:GNAT family N-acetyltransferase [Paracoccus sulfuroxidans]TWI35271.1 RimJ/RimL family protein N-acetyltransferase [Paracoccus sulfuroxidans]